MCAARKSLIPRKWTPAEVAKLKKLHATELSCTDICSILDRSKLAVRRMASKLGLENRPRKIRKKKFGNNIFRKLEDSLEIPLQ